MNVDIFIEPFMGEYIGILTMSLVWEIIRHVFFNEIVTAINIAAKEKILSQAFLDFVISKSNTNYGKYI